MKTKISKLIFALIFLSFGFSYANDNLLKKLVNDNEFVKFIKAHRINQEILLNAEYHVTQFQVLNVEIYKFDLANNENLLIVRDKQNDITQYFYAVPKKNLWVINDKNNVNILEVVADLQCVIDTVAYMKKACNENATCNIVCDLSPDCIPYMYIIAYAHCASGGQAPKASVISNN